MASRTELKIFSLALIAIVSIVHACVASGDERSAPAPTGLESFVAKPTVVLDVAEEVGSLRSGDASVVVAAVIASDTALPGVRMRGVRFVMENNTGADRVYLDETQLALLIEDLAGIDGGIPELEAGGGAPTRVQGTAACWMPARPMRILCPSYRVGPDWTGLHLAAYGSPGFMYPNQRPAELKALVEQAIARLGRPETADIG
jgi:hypothetical protein